MPKQDFAGICQLPIVLDSLHVRGAIEETKPFHHTQIPPLPPFQNDGIFSLAYQDPMRSDLVGAGSIWSSRWIKA